MEWKTIHKAGYIASQANLPRNQRNSVAADFLDKVVEEFARASHIAAHMERLVPAEELDAAIGQVY